MIREECRLLLTLTVRANRYEAYCASLAAHGSVAPPWYGMTIPRRTRKGQAAAVKPLITKSGNPLRSELRAELTQRQQPRSRALLVTEGNPFRDIAMNAHYTSSNYCF